MADTSLYDDINNLIVERLKMTLLTGEKVNLPDWVSDMAQCMADMILQQPEREQLKLIAHAHDELDDFIREKTKL